MIYFGIKTSKSIETKVSPVLNITYSVKKEKGVYFLKQYNPVNNDVNTIKIENTKYFDGFDKKIYDKQYYDYLKVLLSNLGENSKNIIFSPTTKESRKIAIQLANGRKKISNTYIDSLVKYYRETVHENYELSNTLEHNIAYHNGKLPKHVRRTLEYAIKDKNMNINNLVCTTTLMQGINLPTQNVIVRNPHLYTRATKKNNQELSSYDMANLRGRAGRLLKDFIGRTYVYNENQFEEIIEYEEQDLLFGDTTKELNTGYKEKFEEHKNEILQILSESEAIDSNTNAKHIITHIRQTIIKYGNKAMTRLKDIGISITEQDFYRIKRVLDNLDVPREICLKNRYFDPIILEKLYKDKNIPELPLSMSDKKLNTKLRNLLKYYRDDEDLNYLFNRYISDKYSKGTMLSILCNKTIEWAKGKKLQEILDTEFSNKSSDNIEEQIELLENDISYNIPILLKPLYDIKEPESVFLTNIEMGAFKPILKKMIEMDIPRETSIFLYDNYIESLKLDEKDPNITQILKTTLKDIKEKLPFWIKVQLEFIL